MDTNDINIFLNGTNYRHLSNSRRKLKEKLVEYKGGKCERCGYNKCITALEFHHLDPKEKDFSIGNNNVLSFEKCKKEADKCILVCSNCHREIHYEEFLKKQQKEEEEERKVFAEILNNRDKYDTVKNVKQSYKFLAYTNIFDDIEKNVRREDILKKYHINNRTFKKFLEENGISYSKNKVVENKPSKDELIALLKDNSKTAIGRMYGVSCSAVRKWCKKYEI
jgi:transposase